jgi:hypothetical protein
VSGVVPVSASASDNVGVTKVVLEIDGLPAQSLTAAPYTFSWNTAGLTAGTHSLQTVAYDAAGNTGASAQVHVDVAAAGDTTAPAVSITSPSSGTTVARNTVRSVTAAASDNIGVARVELYVNNSLIGTDTSAPYSWSWKVGGKNNASYTLKAIAFDAAGNSASATSTVTAR